MTGNAVCRALTTWVLWVAIATHPVWAEEPFKRMLDDTLVFTGTETLPRDTAATDEIVIGLFAPDDEDHPVGRDMARGAVLAVDQTNAAGGVDGRSIRLVRRWADDPWGAGANEVARLAFEDRSWAIIGGPDGASTHIAEQVATKAHISLVAPISSDPSLTHTRVPWIFRLPPDDAEQARMLIDAAVRDRKLTNIGLVTATDFDSRAAASELRSALEDRGAPPIFHLEISPDPDDTASIARHAASFDPGGIIIRVPRDVVHDLVVSLDSEGLEVPLYLPWIPGELPGRFPLPYPGDVTWLEPAKTPRSCGAGLKLERAYIARFGERPTPSAVYGYDAARLIIDGLMAGASGRVNLRDRIADLEDFAGAAGPVAWDQGGGNTGARPVLRSQ